MTGRLNKPLRLAAVAASTTVVCAMTAFPAAAADGDVQVTNTETVQVYTSSAGEVESQRVYEQISMTGNGTVDLKNPISDDGVRNLDGFGGFDVDGGIQTAEVEVSGEERLRSVSDFNGELPLDVSVEYRLDGERVEPGDVVGESGQLEVTFTVRNITGEDREVSFPDGNGGTVTKTVNVPIPMVGSLTTNTPSSFTDVKSKQANMAGDGKGGTKLSFTMTLFPPIGSDTAEFGYTATISDGIVPEAAISALPVNPLESPTFATAATSYKGGADTGIELTDGASQIDANLLKLRDGAGELLAGLIKLREGAQQLEAGLAGEAAPGAGRLATGAGELNAGLGKIDDGAGKLADGAGTAAAGGTKLRDGAGRLADGAGRASSGSKKLADGTARLDDGVNRLDDGTGQLNAGATQIAEGQAGLEQGLTTLYNAVDSLPRSVQTQLKSNADYQRLLGTLQKIIVGIGDADDATTDSLMGGLNLLDYGLRSPVGVTSCDQNPEDDDQSDPGARLDDCGAADAAEIIAGKFSAGATKIDGQLIPAARGAYQFVEVALGDACPSVLPSPHPLAGLPNPAVVAPGNPGNFPAACVAAAGSLYGYALPEGVIPGSLDGGLLAQARLASEKLDEVKLGLDNDALTGIRSIKRVLYNASCNPSQTDSEAADFCGISQALQLVQGGVPQLVDELTNTISQQVLAGLGKPRPGCDPQATLRCAAAALSDGGSQLTVGMAELVKGVSELRSGSAQLSAGAGELSGGLTRLDSGADELSEGTVTLEDGLVQLADGAGELADGTGTAADGSGRLADGADELAAGLGDAAEGSGKIAGGLEDAAAGAPKLEDGAQRLSDEGTKKLVAAGQSTAQNYGELYATIEAGAERASAENMAFGAPEGAIGLTAYSYEIQGEDGEGSRNVARGLGGLAVLGAGAAAFGLRRRII